MTVIPRTQDEFDPENENDDTTWLKPKTGYRYYRGIAYFNAEHYKEALDDFDAAMPTRDSLFIEEYYYIGYCKLYLGDTLGACATWNHGLEMDRSIEFRKYKSENNRKINLKYYAEMNAERKSKILIAIDKYCKKEN